MSTTTALSVKEVRGLGRVDPAAFDEFEDFLDSGSVVELWFTGDGEPRYVFSFYKTTAEPGDKRVFIGVCPEGEEASLMAWESGEQRVLGEWEMRAWMPVSELSSVGSGPVDAYYYT